VKVPAGCSGVAAVGDVVACSTLNGVALFAAADGASRGELSTGPLGWQHGVAARAGGTLVSGGDDKRVHAWDVAAKREVASWPVDGHVSAVAVDGDEVVVGLRTGAVLRLFWAGEARPVDMHPGPVRVVAGGGGATASASPGLLKLREGDDGAALDRVVGALVFLDGRRLVAGVERSVVRFEGLKAGAISPAGRDDVRALAVLRSKAGAPRVVSGDASGVVRWTYDDGSVEGELDAFAPGVQALAVTEDGALAVATADKRLEVWTLPARPRPPIGEGVPTVHAVFPRGGLVTGTRDGSVRRLDLDSGEEGVLEVRHTAAVRGLAEVAGEERPEALRVLTGGDDGLVKGQRWNGAVEVLDSKPGQKVTALAASRDGQRAAWTYDDGSWVLWSLAFGKEIARGQGAVSRALAFSADGRTLALGREDKRVQLLEAEAGHEQGLLGPVDAAVTAVAFGPDGLRLATGSADGRVTTWELASRRVLHQLNQARSRVSAVDVSPDGHLLAAGSDDGDTLVWDFASGQLLARVPADAGDALLVAFRGPGALVSVGTDRVVHRWSISTVR
jgi:WD40 repeat protein